MPRPDIILRLQGGLGNQIFQYAFFRSLQTRLPEKTIKIHLACDGHNGFELDKVFGIDLSSYFLKDSEYKYLPSFNFFARAIRKFFRIFKFQFPNYFFEMEYGYHPEIYSKNNSIYLDGYWQSEKFFTHISDELKNELSFIQDLPENVVKIINEMSQVNSCSVHVRRGDYTTWASSTLGGICTSTYYKKAFDQIKRRVENVQFYIISDDPEWCRNEFPEAKIIDVVKEKKNAFWDMILMGACKHHITANSSFSWWSVWLGKNGEENITLTPNKWYTDKVSYRIEDIICSNWEMVQ